MDFRPATLRDKFKLSQLETLCFSDPWNLESLKAHLESPSHWSRLGQLKGESTAYALWRVVFDEAELLRIGVVPFHRGRGFGETLLRQCFRELQAQGINDVFLEVRRSNLGALALYRATDWRAVGERPKYYADGEDALLFSRNLA